MKTGKWKIAVACLAAAWTFVSYGSPAYAGDDVEVDKDVRVRVIKCHGDDCGEVTERLKGIEDIEVILSGLGGGGYLGVGLTELTPELREHFGVTGDAGVMVAKVVEDSPAFKAGVRVGDIITSADGEAVTSGSTLAEVIRAREAGDEVRLDVWREGAAQTITAAVETRKSGLAALPLDDAHHGLRKIMIHCDSEDEDCRPDIEEIAGLDDFDCGGADDCRIEVKCQDGTCECSINGAVSDCAEIPGVPAGQPADHPGS